MGCNLNLRITNTYSTNTSQVLPKSSGNGRKLSRSRTAVTVGIAFDIPKQRCEPLGDPRFLYARFRERPLKKTIFVLLISVLLAPSGMGAAQGDVTAPIHQFIDGFNRGHVKSAYAAYATGDIIIVDEFA